VRVGIRSRVAATSGDAKQGRPGSAAAWAFAFYSGVPSNVWALGNKPAQLAWAGLA